MSSPLQVLRDAAMSGSPITFYSDAGNTEVDSIKDASHAKFGDEIFPLDTVTNFYNDDVAQPLKAVVFCWIHDKSSVVDYKSECLELGINDFKFLVKTELNTWLNGSSDTCTFIKSKADASAGDAVTTSNIASADTTKKRKLEDPQLDRISEFEKESIDHNAALRGLKNIEFGYLISDAKRFIAQLKGKSKTSKTNGHVSGNKKQPIIIVSPATTSLISLTNIKQFLEDGKFAEPSAFATPKPANGIVNLHHSSDRIIPAGQNFMVVDNVDVFTKPEYWDRVVAIFTTGQTWQFAKYKYSKPEDLFQRYAGFFVSYQSDVVPKQIKDWNITEIKVDRGDKRFRDKMIVRDFWADIEKILISKGYGANN